jgi:hypothetical protein
MNRRLVLAPWPALVAAAASLAVAIGLYLAAVALGHDATAFGTGDIIRGETPGFFSVMIGGTGLIVLVVTLVVGARGGVGLAVAVLMAAWAVALIGAGPVVRVDFVLAGAGHLAVAELAFWSIERRSSPGPDRGAALATRVAELGLLVLVAIGAGWLLAGMVAGIGGGVTLDLLGVAAVLAFGLIVVGLVRRA